MKSTSETIPRWSPQSTAVIFTGLSLEPGGKVSAPGRKAFNILICTFLAPFPGLWLLGLRVARLTPWRGSDGDSITEGVRTLGWVGIANDTDRNDAVRDYSYQLTLSLPAEIGIVGFGDNAFTHPGSGGVPILSEAWDYLWEGQKRVFDPPPDLVIYSAHPCPSSPHPTSIFPKFSSLKSVC